jgi:hypothetical protein
VILPQYSPYPGYAIIILDCPSIDLGLVHGPEFYDLEWLTMVPEPFLGEEDTAP